MMAQFISLIRGQVDKAIYVWGGQGEVATEELIRRKETSPTNANRAIRLMNERKSKGIEPLIFDCSGLAVWAFQTLRLMSYDTTAEGLRRLCEPTEDPQIGDLAFSAFNSSGQAQHMGIVTREGIVTEARGRDHGVVDTPISQFQKFGKNPFIKRSDIMLQKGDKGEAVYNFQTLLKVLEYDLGGWKNPYTGELDGRDGSYGGHMERLVRDIEESYQMPRTGIVTDDLYGKLVVKLITKYSTSDEQEQKIIELTHALDATEKQLVEANRKAAERYDMLVGYSAAVNTLLNAKDFNG
jgi:hypothetical protein